MGEFTLPPCRLLVDGETVDIAVSEAEDPASLGHDLDDVLIEVAALEEALRDTEAEVDAL